MNATTSADAPQPSALEMLHASRSPIAQHAVDVAVRYRPARSETSGDWIELVALPENRVAMAVGSVVGCGPRARAWIGRLRGAVRNLASTGLPPDELLSRLDHLATRWGHGPDAWQGFFRGATCLYAIYDPVSRRCAVSLAGHRPPAVISPHGRVEFPDVPAGPPLGLGGGSFTTAEWEVPEGSQLVLCGHGLIQRRGRGANAGSALLRRVLSRAVARKGVVGPEETCAAVFEALRPVRPGGAVALMVARTRGLRPDQIADWDVSSEPAAVADLRAAVTRQLAHWGLDDLAFTTELILSELVNNAIRYTTGPIHLRLLCDHALTCEVFDSSTAIPHLHQASTMDEGGRGLFLVARLAERWGTRCTQAGKVIWTEQPLPQTPAAGMDARPVATTGHPSQGSRAGHYDPCPV
ncbi:Histidine kinase-like ATPase domain-containing protein [Streptomyces mirabilis]|uniref:Histidine kinase-like ATPase domain-containing protein n=1 Tax=Streptomyces mirabilis TaxID=68239 RepID=A0A1I2V4D5_9ACTN|nr:Histidine kinase-like ATPase domain-containing protein [Streptomyces mirabilis]